ncbi:MAG: hypothetical protein AVDCRST_MAG96-1788 [uncultured Segetibacter sp.]|uniref:Uncharacterized protein n=1 Tax=uncultured Segetibacter sp. TaxID=481133 RepID=A0A6J4SF34_9BACT|nr:MAG: hypothetical protein AVDCRST_MAG96-1788 [uncultured Segetibacter sp.]
MLVNAVKAEFSKFFFIGPIHVKAAATSLCYAFPAASSSFH